MSMEELVLKMLFCLVAALLIGFLFGWLITRASARNRYTAEIDEINNELIDKNVEVDNLTREVANHHELKKNLLADLEIKDTEISGLHDVVGRQKNDLLAVKSDLDLKDKKVQEFEKVIPSFESKIATLEDAYNAKRAKVAELEEDYNNLRSEIGSLQQEQDKKHEEVGELISEKNSYISKIKELEDVINQKNIASLELDHKAKELDNYARENNHLQESLKEANSKLQAYQRELEAKGSNNDKLSELSSKNSKLEEEIRVARAEAESYKNSLAKTQEKVNELHASANMRSSSHEPTNSNHTPQPALNADLESENDGFSFIKLAKDTISKLTESGEEIIKRGDDAIDTYKNKKS